MKCKLWQYRLLLILSTVFVFSLTIKAENRSNDIVPKAENESDQYSISDSYLVDDLPLVIKEVVPLIEEFTGRKFSSIPPIKIAKEEEVASLLEKEIKLQISSIDPKKSEEQVNKESREMAETTTNSYLGLYSLLDSSIYITPTKLTRFEFEDRKPILKLILFMSWFMPYKISLQIQKEYLKYRI